MPRKQSTTSMHLRWKVLSCICDSYLLPMPPRGLLEKPSIFDSPTGAQLQCNIRQMRRRVSPVWPRSPVRPVPGYSGESTPLRFCREAEHDVITPNRGTYRISGRREGIHPHARPHFHVHTAGTRSMLGRAGGCAATPSGQI